MNLLLAAALVVFLAEWGGGLAGAIAQRPIFTAPIALALIAISAFFGYELVLQSADETLLSFLVVIALALAAISKIFSARRPDLRPTLGRALVYASKSPTPLLVMALSAKYVQAPGAAIGAVLGLGGAATMTMLRREPRADTRRLVGVMIGVVAVLMLIAVLLTG